MRLATVEEAQRIDSRSQKERGLSAEILMEAAGALAAREINQSYYSETKRGPVLVVCGPGNNGGDGFVVARQLRSMGVDVHVAAIGNVAKRSSLTSLQMKRALDSGVSEVDSQVIGPFAERAALIVDALFGIGLSKDVLGLYGAVVEAVNSSRAPVVSLDTPSGLDCDRGIVRGVAVHADLTITFGVAKRGFFVSDGPAHVGRIRVLPIGFPSDLVAEEASTHRLVTGKTARRLLPTREASSNKSDHGRAGIIAGREGYVGALILASHAAMRVGAGYVIAVSHADPRAYLADMPEVLTFSADDSALFDKAKFSSVAIGPGLGVDAKAENLLRDLLKRGFESVVVDADAITVVAQSQMKLKRSWILTPHAGELSRLLDVPSSEIESDRFRYASEAARRLGCIVLLKGFRTVISDGARTAVIGSGNAALGKAGSGDVLTGMIAGLLAQGMKPFAAACLAAYLHGRLADLWVKSGHDVLSLEPSDLSEALPMLIRRVREGGDA